MDGGGWGRDQSSQLGLGLGLLEVSGVGCVWEGRGIFQEDCRYKGLGSRFHTSF